MTASYLSAIGNVYGLQIISTTTSIPPIVVSSSNMVSNLNVQYLGGQPPSFYTNASNLTSGVISPSFGGTGLSSFYSGQVLYATSSNSLGQTENFVYDTVNSNIKINQLNITTTSQAPFIVSNSNFVSNLNVQYLNNQLSSYYTNATNIQSGILNFPYGGTGLSSLSQGFIPFGQGVAPLGFSSNLFWNDTNYYLGIGTSNPQYSIDVVGSVNVTQSLLINGVSVNAGLQLVQKGGTGLSSIQPGYILFGQDSNQLNTSSNFMFYTSNQQLLVSSVSISSNLNISTSNLVSNLNAQYLAGQLGSYYTNANNILQGILNFEYGGTGLSSLSMGFIPFGQGSSPFGYSSNLFWNNANNYLGIGNSNPQYSIDVVGSVNVTQSLLINGISVNAGLQLVQKGGTGLSNVQPGYLLFGQDNNQLNTSSNLTFNTTNQQLAISSISISSNLNVSTSNLVSNLNAQYLGGLLGSYYTNATNISTGVLAVSYGGTGLTSLQQCQLVFANTSNSFGQTSNIVYDQTNSNLKINQANITLAASNTSQAPFIVSNSNLVSNLNVQYLNSQLGSYYTNANNISVGLLNTSFGGTGLSSFLSGAILYASSSNALSQTSNLVYNSSNQNVLVSQLNITLSSSNTTQAPFIISNSNLVSNLNVQYLNNQLASFYTNANNIQQGILSFNYGGTGLSSLSQGFIPFGQGSNPFASSSNLFWDSTNFRLGIRNPSPLHAIDVVGSFTCSSNIYFSNQLISSVFTGTSPFNITSTTLVSNLNVQYLNGQLGSYYTNATNINSGLLSTSFGGTGLTSFYQCQFVFAVSSSSLSQTSNLAYDPTNSNIKINQLNITLPSSNTSQAPFIISNSNLVSNLNTQYFNNQLASYYTNASNINSGILSVAQGGTGLSSLSQGFIPFGAGLNSLSSSSKLFWDSTNQRLGINNPSPSNVVDVVGNISASSNVISSNQFISTLPVGTSPFSITSTTLVTNLNVQYLSGQSGLFYTNACNISSGVLNTLYGGTGLSSFESGFILYASGSNTLAQTSNLAYDSANSNIKINQLHITLASSNTNLTPFIISNSNLVSNLNVQYLNGQLGSFYTNATNVSSGVLAVSYGGTGLHTLTQGYIPFGQGSTSFGFSSNFFWDSTNLCLGIRNSSPQHAIDVIGSITCSSNIYFSNQLFSTIATGTSPFSITSTTLVPNLNVQYLNGLLGSYYTNATNINSGILSTSFGGTGLSSFNSYQFIYAVDSNSLGQTSNLAYDSANSNIKINQLHITLSSSNTSQAPFIISNSNLVCNLNVQYLNGQLGSYYTNASNLNSGILSVTYGGTGLSSLSQGFIPFGANSSPLAYSSNLFWDSVNFRLGIRNSSPQQAIDVVGNITCSSNIISSNQFVSTVAVGTAPFTIASTTLVTNLNVQYLNNQPCAYYTNATNINSGTLSTSFGGTGLSSFTSSQFIYAISSNSLGQTSNLAYDSTNSNIKINQLNITLSSSNTSQAPFIISNSNLVSNLNVQYFNGQLNSYYTNVNNINSGILSVTYGGTGLSSLSQGFIPFGASSSPLAYSSNLFWDSVNTRLGIRNPNPQQAFDIVGNITCSSNIYLSNQLISSITVGTAPFSIASTTLVTNLNVQYLNNQPSSYYINASNINSGILAFVYGGTGLSSLSQGFIPFGQGSNPFGSSSNLFWNSTSNYLGINTNSPSNAIDVIGNVRVSSNVISSNQFVSTLAVGTPPLSITSTTLVTNLNVQYLNNNPSSYYTNATNISSGILGVSYGGTGVTTLTQGYIPFGQGSNPLGSSSNLFWDVTNFRLGIRNPSPQQAFDVVGNITCSSNIFSSNQFVSAVTVGTPPFSIASTTLVTNLNVQYLNNQSGLYYTNACNINSGILSVSFGGTGLSSLSQGFIPFGQGSNSLNSSSNLFWDSTNLRLGVRNQLPQQAFDVIGNITCSSNIISSNQFVSTISTGTSPFSITSTTLVSCLNVQYLNGQLGSYYTNASNISSGVLSIAYGGTALTSVSNGFLFFGSNNAFAQSSNLFYNYTSNFLGINTSNPAYPLDINGNTNIKGNLTVTGSIIVSGTTSNTSNSGTTILSVASGGTGLSNLTQGYLLFGQGSNPFGQSSNLFWNSSSNLLGIGTSNPFAPLHIASTQSITYSNFGYLNSNGSIGKTTASSSYTVSIQTAGNILCGGEFDATSDFRLKTNSQTLDLQQQIDFLKKINPITFQWKNPSSKSHIGFSAQDVIKSGINTDELVNLSPYNDLDQSIDDDGFTSPQGFQFSLNYNGFIPIHTKVLQHLIQQSETFKQQINSLLQQSQSYQQQFNHLIQLSQKQQQQINHLLQHLNQRSS